MTDISQPVTGAPENASSIPPRRVNDWASRRPDRSTDYADRLTLLAAAIATVVAGQGMWQFLERVIGQIPWGLRALMFAFLEISVITSAVRARRNMRENYSAGIDGFAVWALTSVSAILAALEAASLPEVLFRLAAPLVAAWLWDRGMALERRRLRGRSIHWRITPERIFVRLGLAEASDRTASDVDAHRRLTRISKAAKRARRLDQAGAWAWRQRHATGRLEHAVQRAVEHSGLASDPARQVQLLDQIGAVYAAADLRRLPAIAPWSALDHPLTASTTVSGHPGEMSGTTPEAGPDQPVQGDDSPNPAADASTVSDEADQASVKRPDRQDNMEAERWIRDRIRGGKAPTQADVQARYGYSNGWASDRIKAARADLSAKGWSFGRGGAATPPEAA